MKIFCSKLALLCSSVLMLATMANADELSITENLYKVPDHAKLTTAPELSAAGPWQVGVETVSVVNPKQLNASDFTTTKDRPLKLEVWYPTDGFKKSPSDKRFTATVYEDETRSGVPFKILAGALRDAPLPKLPKTNKDGFPLVVLSHGYTGYRSIMFYLGEHLASHGYVVAAIDHTDSTNKEVDFSANPSAGFASTLYNRARDQQFVLDYFSSSTSKFSNISNTQLASIVGYSMGGYGAINTVGGCYDFSSERLQQFGFPEQVSGALSPMFSSCSAGRDETDARWKAMVAFAPWGGEQDIHQRESLANITVPSLIVAGEQDDVSGFENGVKKLYQQFGNKDKYLLVYENARHNIAAHPAPTVAYANDLDIGHYFEPSWNSETINRINKHMVLAFLDWHVKGKDSALKYLPKREHALQSKNQTGELDAPWPGFPDRWGMGLRFYRAN